MSNKGEFTLKDFKRRMEGALSVLKDEFAGLRTGRAHTSLLEHISVEAYGSQMPMNQVGTVGVPEPRMLSVQVWDKGLVSAVEKAIRNSSLGLNPIIDGQLLRIPIPELTEERRAELSKVAAQYAEQARVAVRNVRRDGMDQLKRLEKDGDMGEDEHKAWASDLQKVTDEMIGEIDSTLATKEEEIMQV
jgi:ribosome recycling factor